MAATTNRLSFLRAAIAADKRIEETGEAYRAVDVHTWLQQLASGMQATRPKPRRK